METIDYQDGVKLIKETLAKMDPNDVPEAQFKSNTTNLITRLTKENHTVETRILAAHDASKILENKCFMHPDPLSDGTSYKTFSMYKFGDMSVDSDGVLHAKNVITVDCGGADDEDMSISASSSRVTLYGEPDIHITQMDLLKCNRGDVSQVDRDFIVSAGIINSVVLKYANPFEITRVKFDDIINNLVEMNIKLFEHSNYLTTLFDKTCY